MKEIKKVKIAVVKFNFDILKQQSKIIKNY